MAKKKRRKRESKSDQTELYPSKTQWLSNRTAIITLSIISIVMALFMTWNLYPSEGAGALLWGVGFGASIWVVFGLSFLFNTFLRGKQ